MRRDELYLSDILEAAAAIARFLEGIDRDRFLENDLIHSAVLNKLMIIGEAALQVSAELKGRHPEVEWRPIVGFRNVLVHGYFPLDWGIVREAASREEPDLGRQSAAILAGEFPPGEGPGPP